MSKKTACCQPVEKKSKGLLAGILYGLLPHSFCIAFIVLSVIGATAASGLVRRVLLVPNVFQITIVLSFAFATLSALFYLRRMGNLNLAGVRGRWRYLTVLYSTTIAVNLVLFLVIFPAFATAMPRVQAQGAPAAGQTAAQAERVQTVLLEVELPCSGHAPLVTNDLLEQDGILKVTYALPNVFTVDYDPDKLTVERILAFEIFKSFAAKLAG